jgi:hypothetical protein
MPAVRPSVPRIDDFEEPTDVESNPASSRPSLPLASAHPNWEETIRASYNVLESLDRTAPEPKSGFEDGPSDVQTVLDLRAQPPIPGVPTERPVAPRGVITPPPITLRVLPTRELSWNVPRLIIAGAIVISIVVALIVLFLV